VRNRDFLALRRAISVTPAPLVADPNAGDPPSNIPPPRRVVTQPLLFGELVCDAKLYALGFNEAAGNFQTNNFGKGGAKRSGPGRSAGWREDTNNANFSTPA
jgi:hypothetical protein